MYSIWRSSSRSPCFSEAKEGEVMLILTRKPGESVYLGDNVKITVVEIKGHQIRLGIDAPKDLRIYREEIYEQIRDENRQAADTGMISQGLEHLSSNWKGRSGGTSKVGRLTTSVPVETEDGAKSSGKQKATADRAEKLDVVARRKKRSE